MEIQKGMLYITGTPIGNLGDMTLRAIEVLQNVDLIVCEDTRHSLKLLNHFNIKKPLMSLHKHNQLQRTDLVVNQLTSGKSIALITDAGMPCISDPGRDVVEALIDQNIPYTVIPSATAAVTALVLSGFDSSSFYFCGFLPQKPKQRDRIIDNIKHLKSTLIFYCAPHDLENHLEFLYSAFGSRKAALVKEMTKMHETVTFITLGSQNSKDIRGEYVIVVEGAQDDNSLNDLTVKEHLEYYLSSGMDKVEAIKLTAKERGLSKNQVYQLTVKPDGDK